VLRGFPAVAYTFTASDIEQGLVADNPIAAMVAANHQPKRSGDVYVVFRSKSFIGDMDGLVVAASHGSAWRYDRHVPVIFAGNKLRSKMIVRSITPYDIAVTLANKLELESPSGAIGEPLKEVTQ
jgi:hypothetical protein